MVNTLSLLRHHLAAIIPSTGSSLKISERPTPNPDPDEILIAVKAVALSPVDCHRLHLGALIDSYPAVIGNNIAGVIVAKGSNISDDLQVGTHVATVSSSIFMRGAPDYGAFQERMLVRGSAIAPLPEGISFREASMLPVSVITTWFGWYQLGLPPNVAFIPEDKKGLLIWGGFSVGSVVVQVAKMKGFDTYVIASEKHHAYLKELGATKVFDYKDADSVTNIVEAVKDDGVAIQHMVHALGLLGDCLAVLQKVKEDGLAIVAHALPLPLDYPKVDGIEVKFMAPPDYRAKVANLIFFMFRIWLKEKLEKGELVASPKVQLIEGGLSSIQEGLNEWEKGLVARSW